MHNEAGHIVFDKPTEISDIREAVKACLFANRAATAEAAQAGTVDGRAEVGAPVASDAVEPDMTVVVASTLAPRLSRFPEQLSVDQDDVPHIVTMLAGHLADLRQRRQASPRPGWPASSSARTARALRRARSAANGHPAPASCDDSETVRVDKLVKEIRRHHNIDK